MSAGQFFVPEATDWAASAIDTLFKSDGSLAAAIGAANFVYASIGGVMLLWLLMRVVMETGQHGSIAGKNSEVWFPIRFVTAVGLIAPLPPIGLNAAQYITIGVARAGAAAASHVWETAIDASADMKPLIVPVPPAVNDLAAKLFAAEFCMATQNLSAAASGATGITINRTYTSRAVRLSYDGDTVSGGVAGQCGSITYAVRPAEAASTSMATEAADAAQQIAVAHYDATETLRLALRPAAAQLADRLLPPFTSGKPRGPDIDISALMRAYTQTVMDRAGAVIAASNDRLATYKKTATAAGWVKAGAWGLSLAQVNDTLVSAVTGGMPKVAEPRYDWWSGEVYQSERAAMQAAAQWWGEAYTARTASNDWDAYNATNNANDMWQLAEIFDIGRIKFYYDKFLIESGENMLSEMVSLGHTLIYIFWGAFALYIGGVGAAAASDAQVSSHILGIIINQAVPIKGMAAGALASLQAMGPIFWLFAVSFLAAGASLAYLLPLMPAVIWLFAVGRWLMRVIMTVFGAPIWALAHLDLEGEGLGHRASQGYVFLLDLLVRPIVMTLSLIAGYAAIMLFGELFSMCYYEAVRNTITGHHAGITGLVVYTLAGAAAAMQLCRIAMSAVTDGADYAIGMAAWHVGHMGGSAEADAQAAEHRAATGTTQGQQAIAAGVASGGKERHPGASAGTQNGNPGASPGHSMQNSLPGEIGPPPKPE